MCGIAGIYAYSDDGRAVSAEELYRIRDHMTARGPDGAGAWLSEDRRVGLANRRLAIIDLSDRGLQPMTSADGRYTVTFNGEIYNHRELRRALEARGHLFRTATDTEVLLHLYAWKGPEMVHELRGMFAFAVWDGERRGLFLARDPYGIKPLYYGVDGGALRFASQVKALIAGGQVAEEADPAGWAGFFLLGSVPEPFTIYRRVQALPAGASLWVDRDGPCEPARYVDIAEIFRAAERDPVPPRDAQLRMRAALQDSVRHHLVSDVPVGLFLSSGVDSGALLGLVREATAQETQAITVAYEEFRGRPQDEAAGAARVAAEYGVPHHVRVVSRAEFEADLPQLFDAMDQPSIDGVNTWFVSKAARELGLKVALSGLGGDELLGGYPSFTDIPRWVRWARGPAHVPLLGEAFRRIFCALRRAFPSLPPKAAGMVAYGGNYAGAYLLRRGLFMPWELGELIGADFIAEGLRRLDPLRLIGAALAPLPRTAFARVATLESKLYMRNQLLRDTDWASMAHSVEVRVPLVDDHLLAALAPLLVGLPLGAGKRLLAASPRTSLPSDIVTRAKTGFETPMADWLQSDRREAPWPGSSAAMDLRRSWPRRWAWQLAARHDVPAMALAGV